jgi:hypothetical protein
MKISFLTYTAGALLTNRRVAWCIVSLGCLLVGSCLVGQHFGVLAVVLLGIVGILLGGVANAFLDRKKADRTRSARVNKTVPGITSGWDYRPRGVIPRYAAVVRAAAETAELRSSGPCAPNENDNIWFNFTNPHPKAEDAETTAPSSSNGHGLSTYD